MAQAGRYETGSLGMVICFDSCLRVSTHGIGRTHWAERAGQMKIQRVRLQLHKLVNGGYDTAASDTQIGSD